MMTATASHPKRTGVRTELARDTIPDGERIIYGQRIDGVVRVTDVPAVAGGRAYLVERGLERTATARSKPSSPTIYSRPSASE
jgi:hypothetical protein